MPGRNQSGFTLLEISISMLMVGIVFAVAIPPSLDIFEPHPLEPHLSDFRDLVESSLIASSNSRSTTILRFEEDRITTISPQKRETDFAEEESEEISLKLPEGARYEIRLWPSEDWIRPEGLPWRVPAQGLLLPLSIKWTLGDSWLAASVDPLTGEIGEVTYELQ